MVSGGITKDELPIRKAYPYDICGSKEKDNSVLCATSRKWLRNGCAGVMRVTVKL